MFTPFTPTTEPPGTRDPFLNQYPYIASQAGAMKPIPLIAGVTSEEGLYPASGKLNITIYMKKYQNNVNSIPHNTIQFLKN